MVHRQSFPVRSRSSEEFIAVNSPPDDRKKSHTSTQSTTIDTPPKSPPHYGNTLTVDAPELSEAITGLIDKPATPKNGLIVHRESEEFEIDDIDNALAIMQREGKNDSMPNGAPQGGAPRRSGTPARPGTPVQKTSKNSVRFVKPTLTVTLNANDGGIVNDSFDENDGNEEEEDEEQKDCADQKPPSQTETRTKSSRRRHLRNPEVSPITEEHASKT